MTIDDRIEPFFRMFAGIGIDGQLSAELLHEYALYVETGRKKKPFLQDEVSDRVKEIIIRTIHHLEEGACRFIPEEHDLDAIQSWNAAYARAMTFFQGKTEDIFTHLAGRTAPTYATQHVRSEGEKQATLRGHLGEHGRLFDRETREQAGKLRAGKLEAHLSNQPLDMVTYLRTTPMAARWVFDGMIVRAKSADRLARKVAQKWINIWAKYDGVKRKRQGEVPLGDLAVSYKDFLVTDQLAFILFFGKETSFAHDFIFGENMGFRQLEMQDTSTLKIRPKAGTRLRRIKLIHEREAFILDMHVDDLASFIDMQYGESPHSIMVHKQHTDALNGPYCRSYRRIYEQAYRFFLACDMPSVKPELFDLYIAERPARQKTLTSMREPILRRIDYRVDDIARLAGLLRPDSSLKVRKDQDRIAENRRKLKREFSKRFDSKRLADITRELEMPLYETVVGHAYALEDMLREGASVMFDYDPLALSVDVRHQATELVQHTESMMRLHDFFYAETPQAGYLDRQRRFIEEAVADVRFLLERQTPVFEALQAAYSSLEEHGYTPARADREYRHALEAFDQANRTISETDTPYNSIASLKLDVRILLASHVIEFQTGILQQMERQRAEGKDVEMDGDSLSMLRSFRNRVDSIAYGCMGRLSEAVREAYLQRREQFDKLVELGR